MNPELTLLEGSAYVGLNYDFAAKFRAGVKYNNNWSLISSGEIVKNDFSLIKPTVELEAKAGQGQSHSRLRRRGGCLRVPEEIVWE